MSVTVILFVGDSGSSQLTILVLHFPESNQVFFVVLSERQIVDLISGWFLCWYYLILVPTCNVIFLYDDFLFRLFYQIFRWLAFVKTLTRTLQGRVASHWCTYKIGLMSREFHIWRLKWLKEGNRLDSQSINPFW